MALKVEGEQAPPEPIGLWNPICPLIEPLKQEWWPGPRRGMDPEANPTKVTRPGSAPASRGSGDPQGHLWQLRRKQGLLSGVSFFT